MPFARRFAHQVSLAKPEADAGAELAIDAEVVHNDLTFTAVRELDSLGPFWQCASQTDLRSHAV